METPIYYSPCVWCWAADDRGVEGESSAQIDMGETDKKDDIRLLKVTIAMPFFVEH